MDRSALFRERLNDVKRFRTCEQCGTCSSACPMTGVKDFNIRRILRHVELDLIDQISDSPLPWFCTTCARCETVCPNGIAILDIIRPIRSISAEQYVPEGPPACTKACPAGIDVPGYLRLIAQGNPEQAYKVILEKVPFPGILGRVCTHPCERDCRRGEVNQPISICALKRYAADKAGAKLEVGLKVAGDTGHRAAVVGAGPAGLTAAFYLRKKGHQVTVFEGRSKPGGMMRYGIPRYRLPDEVLDSEIDRILSLGVELKTDTKLGRDFDFGQLKREGFEAIFVATGLQSSRRIDLEGTSPDGLFWGIEFLERVNGGERILLRGKVVVIGGGNSAIDAARVAKRLGAEKVIVLYRRTRSEMPAMRAEVDEAEQEGVTFHFLTAPVKILSKNGRLTGIECIRMELGDPDQSGRRSPIPVRGSNFEIDADNLIIAIGQQLDREGTFEELRCSDAGTLSADPTTLKTNIEGVFAGGDAVKGPSSVIEAIESGRRAASSIDRFLGGNGSIDETLAERDGNLSYTGKREKGFADLKRSDPPKSPLSERCHTFSEVVRSFNDEEAVKEARRCLQCDLELRLAREPLFQKNLT
ncbi:MAG: FAD-dependent oxidoreductase [Syntrophaceae bacterium]|nr:FAD-dependent oxidoreductase [Syntrophaceae bacterium]